MRSPRSILARAQSERIVIEEFRPLCESLEWELSRLYFQERGLAAFSTTGDHVPFEINNDGNLSRQAADLLFECLDSSVEARAATERIHVLEVGVGTGLFARFFLRAFRDLCRARGRSYYDRLLYRATDVSPRILDDLRESRVLEEHLDRVQFQVLDARDPDRVLGAPGLSKASPVRAVFVNYVLDMLPVAALRFHEGRWEQLYVRTCLARGADPAAYGTTAEEIAARAASPDPADRRTLLAVQSLIAVEYAYRPVDLETLPHGTFAGTRVGSGADPFLFNYGALEAVRRLGAHLHDEGFLLVRDYGPTEASEAVGEGVHQRFSGSVASAVNFPMVRAFVEERCGLRWLQPEEDVGGIRTRLVAPRIPDRVEACFHRVFGRDAHEAMNLPWTEARECWGQGRTEQALAAYEEALARHPFNWLLMDEVAQFLMTGLGDFEAAREMAEAGLELNPSCSSSLWADLGDCRLSLGREGAEEAYRRALAIDPRAVRGHFGVALCAAERNDHRAALRGIGEALALDRAGEYRDRLLQKQAELLGLLTARYRSEVMNLANRVNRRIDGDGGAPDRLDGVTLGDATVHARPKPASRPASRRSREATATDAQKKN